MAKLKDRELKPDFTKITVREYRSIFADDSPVTLQDEIIGKVYGITAVEVAELNWYDYKVLQLEFLDAARDPVNHSPN